MLWMTLNDIETVFKVRNLLETFGKFNIFKVKMICEILWAKIHHWNFNSSLLKDDGCGRRKKPLWVLVPFSGQYGSSWGAELGGFMFCWRSWLCCCWSWFLVCVCSFPQQLLGTCFFVEKGGWFSRSQTLFSGCRCFWGSPEGWTPWNLRYLRLIRKLLMRT